MVTKALWVMMQVKPGKEAEVEEFLRQGQSLVEAEPGTVSWYALKIGPSTYGIYDTFEDEAGRDAHLTGKVAEALMAKAPDLFSEAPSIEKVDVLAVKVPSP